MIPIYDAWCICVMHDIQIVLMWTTSNFALHYSYKYYHNSYIYYHIISFCIHYKCKHKKQVFPCTTWTLKLLYDAGHKLKHFWSQIVPGHKLKHYVVTNRAAVTNWSESQIVPSHTAVRSWLLGYSVFMLCVSITAGLEAGRRWMSSADTQERVLER